MTPQAQFAAELHRLMAEAKALPASTIRGVTAALEEARQRIVARLASMQAGPGGLGTFTEAQLRSLLAETESALRDFQSRATAAIAQAQSTAYSLGTEIVDAPMAAIQAREMLTGINRNLVSIAQGYSARLVKGLRADALRQLDQVLHQAALGGQSLPDVIRRVGLAIGGDTAEGSILGGIGSRAATITHTELRRMTSAATQTRLEQYAERVPEMEKGWRHVAGERHPRPRHLLMHGQTVRVDRPFIVPQVGVKLRFPGDPLGPASETINCHCFVFPVPPGLTLAGLWRLDEEMAA